MSKNKKAKVGDRVFEMMEFKVLPDGVREYVRTLANLETLEIMHESVMGQISRDGAALAADFANDIVKAAEKQYGHVPIEQMRTIMVTTGMALVHQALQKWPVIHAR